MSVTQTYAVFERALKAFGVQNGAKFAVAVSGGADSTAVCLLARAFVQKNGGELVALVVDHRLRKCSAEQARVTVDRLERLGIKTRLLVWEGEKPAHGIEQAAREARYRLLAQACVAEGCTDLLLGHHRQDQAETFLIRRAKNSGDIGLAGMSAVRRTSFGRILRPVLGISPADLREVNRFYQQQWVEDETNLSDDFDRGRLRQKLTLAEIEDAFAQTLVYGEKRRRLEEDAACFVNESVTVSDKGYLLFSQDAFARLPVETARFCLGDFLRFIADRDYAPRLATVEALADKIRAGGFSGATLGGCRLAPSTKKQVIVWREMNDLPPAVKVVGQKSFQWDRFTFFFDVTPEKELQVAPLAHQLKIEKVFAKRTFSVLPAIFDNEGLFIVPHLGYKRTKTTCRVTFTPHAFLCDKPEFVCPII